MANLISFELKKIIKSKKNIILFFVMLVLFVGYSSLCVIMKNQYPMSDEIDYYKTILENEQEVLSTKENLQVKTMFDECKRQGKMTDEFLNWDINNCKTKLAKVNIDTPIYKDYSNRVDRDIFIKNHNGKGPYDIYSYEGLFSLNSINNNIELFFIIFFIFLSCDIFSKEYKGGSIKILMIQPFSKAKILLSKYISIVLFTISAFTLTLIINYIINTIAFGYVPIDYPMSVSNNFLSLSVLSRTEFYNLKPLYIVFILTYLIDVCLIFAFSAICLLLSLLFKYKAISLALPSLISLYFANFFYEIDHERKLFNIYSFCNTKTLLDGTVFFQSQSNPLTFLDGIVVPILYALVFFGLSLFVLKRKQFER